MEPIYYFLIIILVLLIVNIIFSLRRGKNEEKNEITEIKNTISMVVQNLKDTERNIKFPLSVELSTSL